MSKRTTSRGLPDGMVIMEWQTRAGLKKAYYLIIEKNGRRTKRKLSDDRTEAMRLYAEAKGQEVPQDLQTPAAAWALFKSHPRGLTARAPRTQTDYRLHWKQLEPVFGAAGWDQIERSHAIQYLDRRSSRHGANKEIKFLSQLWSFALNRGLTRTSNGLVNLEYHSIAPRDRYVTDSEYKAIMRAADPIVRDAMRLAYLTGQRPADVLRMCWSDVGQDNSVTVVQGKTGKRVEIEAGPELAGLLSELRKRPVAGLRLVAYPNGRPVTLRAKSASDSQDGATERLGHGDERITRRVYRRTATKAKSTA